jgi:PAS domain-containing protein
MDRIQKTFRLPVQLDREFTDYLKETGQNANEVVQGLIAEKLERWYGVSLDAKQLDYLQRFWIYLPIAAAIKEVHGRVIFGNPEFRRLVGCNAVTGALPLDYFREDEEVAKRVMAHDHAALEHQMPILSVDTIPIGGQRHERLAIRFPIFDRSHKRVEMTGVIGFDLPQVERMARDLQPGQAAKFEVEQAQHTDDESLLPDSMLRAFIYNLPAILTVKALDDSLLCVNAEYTRVTGRQRSEVIGNRPTQNWQGKLGEFIETCDREVREQHAPIMSVETLPHDDGVRDRLNIRFPILGSKATPDLMDCIGTIGFDYRVIKKGIELLRDTGKDSHDAFLLSDDPDSLKGFPISV